MIVNRLENNHMLFDTWEEVLDFVKIEGKKWGWELRTNSNADYDPVDEGYLKIYRKAGVPEIQLPPKYMELWATKSCFVSPVGIPIWITEKPQRVGWVGTGYIFDGCPDLEESRIRYTLKLDDEF